MAEKFIIKKGIKIWLDKDSSGKYYVTGSYPVKRAPDSNKARIAFYKKNNLGKRVDKVNKTKKRFRTLTSAKNYF